MVVNIVFYEPSTGVITASAQMDQHAADADPRSYIIVDDFVFGCDVTHHIVDGKMVEIA
jgi:hypothetical protein